MCSEWWVWSFIRIQGTGSEIQWRKIFFLQVKFSSLLTDRNQNFTVVAHVQWTICVEFRKDSWNRRWDTVEKGLCPSSKVPSLLTDHIQNYTICRACAVSDIFFSFRKIHEIEVEIPWIKYFVLQVKCPSLSTNRNQTYNNCSACTLNNRRGVSEVPWNRRWDTVE